MTRRLVFDQDHCLACKSCELACAVVHSESQILSEAIHEFPRPQRRVRMALGKDAVQALRCVQCEEPLCVMSCKSGALARSLDDGQITFDQTRCIGCWMCVMVCPVGVSPDHARQVAVRCDVCLTEETPACVLACPTGGLSVIEQPQMIGSNDFDGHVVVVGSSAAGIAACEAVRREAPCALLSLVTDERDFTYSRPMLPYLLSGMVDRSDIDWREEGNLSDGLSVSIEPGMTAVQLLPNERSVLLSNGSAVTYDRLIIATGARASLPDIPGIELCGVFALRSLADVEGISDMARSARQAVILGGGNVGLQAAEALSSLGVAVTVIVRSPHLLSQMVDEAAARRVESLFMSKGITVHTGTDIAAILGEAQVTAVRLDNGEELPAGLVIIGKGIHPNVDWLDGSGLRIGRGITVDASCRTNLENVFAAGDCAEAPDPLTGEPSVSGIWPMANEMGYVAGSTAVGIARTIPGALRMNTSTFFGVPVVSIGVAKESALPDAQACILANDENTYRKLVFHGSQLVGAVLYNNISGAGTFYRLYRERTDIDDVIVTHLKDSDAERVLLEYVEGLRTIVG
jgi:nitrite reductase (NADH) large subunit